MNKLKNVMRRKPVMAGSLMMAALAACAAAQGPVDREDYCGSRENPSQRLADWDVCRDGVGSALAMEKCMNQKGYPSPTYTAPGE